MPQTRRDDKGCATGLSPHTLLFATRSSVRNRTIARMTVVQQLDLQSNLLMQRRFGPSELSTIVRACTSWER